MHYILEMININPIENLFYHQIPDVDQTESCKFFTSIRTKHIARGAFTNTDVKTTHNIQQRSTGEWVHTVRIGNFRKVSSVVDYYKELTVDTTEYRKKRRIWHNEHKITSEANILDSDGNLVSTFHSCALHICSKFTNCPSEKIGPVGCEVPQKSDTIFHIPLTSIQKLVG
jgi:hypothetical protein